MSDPRREQHAQMHDGEPTVPRAAATVLVMRDADPGPEVLMVQRNPAARFMGGAWVFPGGAVDPADGAGEQGVRNAARRELQEEAGILLPETAPLVALARWVTPRPYRTRFDTWFFLAPAPEGQTARTDQAEVIDHRWVTPAAALQAGRDGQMFLVFPTIRMLNGLSEFASVEAAMAAAPSGPLEPIEPRIIDSGGTARETLPGDPDYPGAR